MKIRFKLRTLLITTALVAVYLGLQIHVHIKAKRFVEEMMEHAPKRSSRHEEVEYASLAPPSFSDIIRFERRCQVLMSQIILENADGTTSYAYYCFRVGCFGKVVQGDPIVVDAELAH